MTFIWKGEQVSTIGDLFDAAVQAVKDGEAQEFLREYRAANEHADENLGYVIGYADPDTRARMYEAFDLSHPVFGGRP